MVPREGTEDQSRATTWRKWPRFPIPKGAHGQHIIVGSLCREKLEFECGCAGVPSWAVYEDNKQEILNRGVSWSWRRTFPV